MCGIAGYMGEADKKILSKMLTATAHRGPDDRGMFVHQDVGLGQNRLAIIDLSPLGKQPMFDSEKTTAIVFGGEIYNYLELKKQLTEYTFRSKTDTEVLLYAYKKWGVRCVEKLNGMFHFVIYDMKKNLLFGARDRIGEKPLKYYIDNNIFAFASEIKGLLPALQGKPELDPIAIHHYLTLQYVPAPYTGFKNVFKLPPAHYFIYKNGKLSIKQYWNLSFANKLSMPEDEWEELLLEKMKESVTSRLVSDVPLGAFLSGGIDSSSIVALMSEHSSKRIKTFSIGFENPTFDESNFAKEVARQYNTDHKSLTVTNKMMGDVFEHLSDHYDEPFGDNSSIPMFLVSKLARRYVTVALAGDGGDENFAGYERYNIVAFEQIYKKIPKAVRSALTIGTDIADSLYHSMLSSRARTYTKTFDLPFYKKYVYYSCFFTNDVKARLYSKEFKKLVSGEDAFAFFKPLYTRKLSDLDNALSFDIKTYLPEDLLYKSDIASMANALEVRAPFLNHELLELTAQMPHDLKIKFFTKKYIFKKIMERNHYLPKTIVNRPKRGFVSPIEQWLRNDYNSLLVDQLSSKKFRDTNIFDNGQLEKYIKDYSQKKELSSNTMFALLSLASWIQKYL